MTIQNNYFDDTDPLHPYTNSTGFNKGSIAPTNALRGEPPEINPGFWPCEKDGEWIQVEDHRQQKDETGQIIEGTGTPYYLSGDTHQSEARYMTTPGALPENALQVKPEKTLEEAKTAKLAEITAEKNRRKQAGFIYMGKVFEADTASVQSLTLAAQSAAQALSSGQEFAREWTVKDDSKITLNAEQLLEIIVGIETRANELQQESRLLKDTVQAAETLAEVEAVIWPSI